MEISSKENWDAISAVVTAIGVLVALALGVHANIIQRNQVKEKIRRERALAKAWAAAAAVEIASSLVRLKKIYAENYYEKDSIDFLSAMSVCSEISEIRNPVADRIFDRLDIFDVDAARSVAVYYSSIVRYHEVSRMIEEGRSLYHESGNGNFLVIKEWLDVVIQYGVIAMAAMYSISELGAPPDLDRVVRASIAADVAEKSRGR